MQNDAPWVTVSPVSSASPGMAWRCTYIHHMTPAENAGKHNIFVDCIRSGQVVRDGSVRIAWKWAGQRSDETAKPAICDKRAPDHSTDTPIEKGQYITLLVDDGKGTPSDIIGNLNAVMDGADGNSWHHHSYMLTFELTSQPSPIPPPSLTMEQRMARVEAKLGL